MEVSNAQQNFTVRCGTLFVPCLHWRQGIRICSCTVTSEECLLWVRLCAVAWVRICKDELLTLACLSLQKAQSPYSRDCFGLRMMLVWVPGAQTPNRALFWRWLLVPFYLLVLQTDWILSIWLLPFLAQGGTLLPREGFLSPAAWLSLEASVYLLQAAWPFIAFCCMISQECIWMVHGEESKQTSSELEAGYDPSYRAALANRDQGIIWCWTQLCSC